MDDIRVLVVDDEISSIETLKNMLGKFKFISEVYTLSDSRIVTEFLRNTRINLVFLDIDMPYMSGLKVAEELRQCFPGLAFIFVTGHTDYALYGYEVYPIDFLVKPINPLRLEKAIAQFKEKRLNRAIENDILSKPTPHRRISVRDRGSICFVNIHEINFVEKRGRKCIINVRNNHEIECNNTLNELEKMLSRYDFVRPHQSYLIPVSKISEIKPDKYMRSYVIEIENVNAEIRVSKHRYSELKKVIFESL
ncbi:LytTR family DNA-binding domain-containing protein [Metabacillus indicus]|uniref:LytR/AlgR family response regulator transcription factor n=1 Tax=Metabacillus indicus TaxID=246786 RepID=UPI003173D5EC